MNFHPFSQIFPPMSHVEFESLVASIEKNGQRTPILTYRGEIVDGVHRYKACERLGIAPEFNEWNGEGSLVDLVAELNIERRSLTPSQRTVCALEIEKLLAAEIAASSEPTGRVARDEAAKAMGCGSRTLGLAKKIAEASPEAAERIRTGKTTVNHEATKLGFASKSADGKSAINRVLCDSLANGNATTVNSEYAAIGKEKSSQAKTDPPAVQLDRSQEDGFEPTLLADLIEEREEQRAIREEGITEEEWLKSFPLSSLLTGRALAQFYKDAIDWRDIQDSIKPLKKIIATVIKRRRNSIGPYARSFRYALSQVSPALWIRCADVTSGGCGGTGVMNILDKTIECSSCKGRGYRVR